MSREQNIAAQEKFGEGVNNGNLDVIDEVMAPGVVDHDPAPDQGPGPQGFKDFFGTMRSAFPDLEISVEHMTATDDDVAIAYTIRGTHQGDFLGNAPTGERIEARGAQIARFNEDGKIVERWGSTDQRSILRQIGALGGQEEDKGLIDKVKDKLTGQ